MDDRQAGPTSITPDSFSEILDFACATPTQNQGWCTREDGQYCQEVALRLQSEEQNQAILSAIPDILTVIDAEGIYLSISYNRFSGTLIPLENMDVTGMRLSEVLPPAAAARTLKAVHRALATGTLQMHEQEILFGDRIQYEEVRIVPYQADRVLCMVRDISDRKQTEIALRQSEAKQRALIRALPDLIMQITREGVYVDFYTTSQFQVLGNREKLVGTHIRETLPPDLAQKRLKAIQAALDTGELQVYEQDLWIDGQPQTEECRVVVCDDNEVLVIGRDITDRKRAVAQLESQNVLLARIAKGEPLIDILHDLIRQVEQSFADASCAILLADENHRLHYTAAPNLPESFLQKFPYIPIEEGQGSFGTAAFRKQTVIVPDIANDPLWAAIKQLPLSHGLRACWSTPIIASDGRVLGVFGVYYREVRSPHSHELDTVAQIANIAGIAIEREQAETALRQSEAKNRAILAAIPDLLLRVKRDGTCLDYIPPAIASTQPGFLPIQHTIAEAVPPDMFQYQLERMEQAITTGELQVWEQQLFRFDTLCHEEVRLVHSEGDELLMIVRDISDRKLTEAALKASQERYRQIIETQTDFVIRSMPDTTITFANPAFCRALGLSFEQAIGMQWMDAVPPEEMAVIYQKIANLSPANPTYENVNADYRANGELGWTQWVNLGIFNERGELVEIQSVGRDITERKQAEADLRTQRNLLRAFLDNLPHMAWLKDKEGKFITVNAAFGAICGLPPAEIEGKTDHDFFPLELAQAYRKDDLAVIESRQRKQIEEPLVTADGSIRWIDTIKTPIYDAQDDILGTVGIAIDLTERKQAELALQESEARYRRIVETANEGIWIINTDSQTSFVNPKMAEMLGYSVDEMLGRSLLDFMDEGGKAIALQKMERRRQGMYEQHDFKFQHKDGHDIWTIISTNPILDDAGQYIGALGMITDISDRKHIELSLKHTNELLSAISKAQTQFITDADPGALFDNLLETLLQLTNSEYGFIGEILYDAEGQAYIDESYMKLRGQPYLKTKAITNIAWNEETRRLYEENAARGMEFHNLHSLFGQVITTGQPVIANGPNTDPRRGGLPEGHPPLNAFLGIPFYRGEQLVGMVGIANRPKGYSEAVITALEPFLTTCSSIIEAYRNDTRRKQAENALRISQERMQTLINALPFGVWVRDADERVVLQNSIDMARYGNLLGTTLDELPDFLEWKAKYYQIKDQYNIGEFFTYESVESLDNQDYFFLRIEAPLPDIDGRKGIFGVAVDISDRKRAELALQELNEDLEKRVEQRTQDLIRSEQDLRTIFNNVYDAILIHDMDGTILDANDRALQLRQATREQLLGATILDLSAPDAPIDQLPDILQRVQTGETMRFEWRERRFSDQVPFDVEVSLRKVTLSNRPVIIAGVRDISDRKQSERALRESQQFIQTVLDTVPLPMFWKDRNSVFLGCNQQLATVMEMESTADLIGRTGFEFSPTPDEVAVYLADDRQVMESGTAKLAIEETFTLPDGEQRWIETHKAPLRDWAGQVVGIVGMFQDITERKQSEQALLSERLRLQLALDAAQMGTWSCNPETGVLQWSDRAQEIFGFEPGTFPGDRDTFQAMIYPEDYDRVMEAIAHTFATGAPYNIEYRIRRLDGELRWLGVWGIIPDRTIDPIRQLIGVVADISDRKQAEQDLQESRNMLELVLDAIPQRVFWKDRESRFLGCNRAFAQDYRMTPDEIIGKTDLELPWGEWAHLYRDDDANVIQTRTPKLNYEEPTHNYDGEQIWIRTSKIPLTNSQGDVLGVLGCYDDITARKQAEQQLQAERLRLQLALEAANMGTWESNMDTGFWSERTEAIFGYARGTFPGDRDAFLRLVHLDDQERVFGALAHSMATQAPYNVEYRINRLDGELRWVAVSGKVVAEEDGSGYRIVGVALDITNRKRAEEALRDNEERLRLALKAANQGLYDLDLQTGEAIVSSEYATMLGYDPATFHETNAYWIERLHPNDRERVAGVYRAYVAGQIADYRVEFRQRTQNGQWKWVLSLGKIVAWNEAGHPLRMLGTHTDIDDRKRLEQELRQINLELEQRVEERTLDLQRAIEAAETANRAKSAFLANMSHELRTPLNAILGFAQLMTRDRTLDDEKRQQLSIINRSGEHLLHLINDILEMSKIEAGRASFTPTNFDLHGLLDALEELFQLRAMEKSLQFRVERTAALPTYVITDENKLRQVLINLVGNAIKFTQRGQVVLRVQGSSPDNVDMESDPLPSVSLRFEVDDTGPGIDLAELDLLFEPFTQSKNRQVNQEGTGLGLPISRQFVQLMGGDLTVESRLGAGSTFGFSIRVQLARASTLPNAASPCAVVGLMPNQPTYRILVVEDHETNRQLLVQLLQSVGFVVRTATNGQEAIALWEHWQPHLIWMDMRMPIMNGYEATRQIRQREARLAMSPTVVIALTASAFEEDRARVLDVGCDDFVRKPFQEGKLLEKIAEHLGVQYIYADLTPAPQEAVAASSIDAIAALQSLPSTLRDQLLQATTQLDSQRLYQLIEQFAADQPELASDFREKVDNFDLDQILALLQEVL